MSQYSDLTAPLIRDDGLPHHVVQRADGTWACLRDCPSCLAAGVYLHGRGPEER